MPDLFFGTSGPRNARIAIIGEAWGETENYEQKPFVGSSGYILNDMLAEAGIARDEVFATNLIAAQPPGNDFQEFCALRKQATAPPLAGIDILPEFRQELERVWAQIEAVNPDLIITCGAWPLWFFTPFADIDNGKLRNGRASGKKVPTGIAKHRGSMHYARSHIYSDSVGKRKLLPIYHPAAVARQWELRDITLHDLRARVPMALADDWRPTTSPTLLAPPTFTQARDFLVERLDRASTSRVEIACDIETIRRKFISTIGYSDSLDLAISIPHVRLTEARSFDSYWSPSEEMHLRTLEQQLFSHPNIYFIGQNFLYDTQYIHHFYNVHPKLASDTMLRRHLLFPGTPKSLYYIASLYCTYYWFWKDENKDWDATGTLEQHLLYNCWDLLRTWESELGLRMQFETEEPALVAQWPHEIEKYELARSMMDRGILVNTEARRRLSFELMTASNEFAGRLERILPQEFVEAPGKVAWYNSPSQTAWVLYTFFGLAPVTSRKTGSITTGKEALNDLHDKYPQFSTLLDLLAGLRSLEVFQNTFIKAVLESDNRMRTGINPGGTETFRWSTSKNAFGRGANMQNIPEGNEDK